MSDVTAKTLGRIIQSIRLHLTQREDKLVCDRVTTFNALALPKMYVSVDVSDVHVVCLGRHIAVPFSVVASADVVWKLDLETGEAYVTKDGTGKHVHGFLQSR